MPRRLCWRCDLVLQCCSVITLCISSSQHSRMTWPFHTFSLLLVVCISWHWILQWMTRFYIPVLYELQGLLTDTVLYCVIIIMMILQVPSLVEKMVSGTPPKHPSLSQESLGLLLKRPWDPIGNALAQQKLVRFFLSISVLTVRISQWDRMWGLCLHSQDCIVSPQSQELHYINY